MKAEYRPHYKRVVLDTNVILSAALLSQSVPAKVVDWLLQNSLLVFSAETFSELETRIWKPKFDRYLSLDTRKQLLSDLNDVAHWVQIPDEMKNLKFSRDCTDDVFIYTALAADVTRLITGDEDLLSLSPLQELRLLSPKEAWLEVSSL